MTEAMTVVDAIRADVQQTADMRNAEVFEKALRQSGTVCRNCDFPKNSLFFHVILQKYVTAKINFTSAKRKWDAFDGSRNEWNHFGTAGSSFRFWGEQVRKYHKMLDPIRPCLECRKRFNPTFRNKWGARTFPDPEISRDEFLKELFDA